MKEQFFKDLGEIYQIIKQSHDEISTYYDVLDEESGEKFEFINTFLEEVGLKRTKENQMSAISRLVTLRDDLLTSAFKKGGFSDDEVIHKKEQAYLWVAEFHLKVHERLVNQIQEKELLTPFYREIFRGTHEVGKTFSSWQSSWTRCSAPTSAAFVKIPPPTRAKRAMDDAPMANPERSVITC